jgi:hypothetical protein
MACQLGLEKLSFSLGICGDHYIVPNNQQDKSKLMLAGSLVVCNV